MPDGNRFPFSQRVCALIGQPCPKTLVNSTIPVFIGAVMTVNTDNTVDLRWKTGTIYHFVPAGFQFSSLLASIRDPNGNTIAITRDSNQRVTVVTDPVGRSLTFAYDSSSRITSITDPIGRSVQYTYNNQGTLATVTDPAGGVTKYDYSAQNNMTRITDARNIVQAQNTLDSVGRVIQQLRPDGGVLTFSYTFLNPLTPTSQVLEAQVIDSKGVQAKYRFNPIGFVTDITATNGETRHIQPAPGSNLRTLVKEGPSSVAYTYDANGNVLSRTDATGRTTQYTYEPVFNKVASITDPLGNVTQFTYDAKGNLLTATDANGHTMSYQYDSNGLMVQSTDALNQKRKFTYDGFGNLVAATDPLGNTTSYSYDGISRLIATNDALGRQTSFTYDGLGRLLTRKDARNGVTQFTYDANGNLLTVKDAKNNTTTFTYDVMNRLATRTDPLGKSDTRSYDTNGNLIQFVDRRGVASNYTYDNLNRLVGESYPDATVTRSYDALGRLIQVDDSASGVFTFAYDPMGRLLNSSTPHGAVNYSFDGRGAMSSRQVVGQPAVTYAYDPAGNLTSASMPQAAASFSYTPRNQVATINRLNGTSTTFDYDAGARLSSIIHARGVVTIDAENCAYDAVGNRTTHVTGIGQSLITQPTINQYDVANRLIQFGTVANAYDANGNLIQEGSNATYTWDSRNRLKSIATTGGQTTSFTYDFVGNLIRQADTGTNLNLSRNFVLDGLTNVAYQSASDGTSYSVLSGRSVDSHLAVVQSTGQIEYGLADGLNSTVETIDQNGNLKSQLVYEPYGHTGTTAKYPFQFTGRMSVGSNLSYNRARYYSAASGRFLSEDPIGLRGGSNFYTYARNNPVSRRDPLGLESTDDFTVLISGPMASGGLPPPPSGSPSSPRSTLLGGTQATIGPVNPPIIRAPYPGEVFVPADPNEYLEQWRRMTEGIECGNGEFCTPTGVPAPHAPENEPPVIMCPAPTFVP